MKTYQDILEQLKHEDELTLLEILDLTSVELVDKLEDRIFDKLDSILGYYGEDPEDMGE